MLNNGNKKHIISESDKSLEGNNNNLIEDCFLELMTNHNYYDINKRVGMQMK